MGTSVGAFGALSVLVSLLNSGQGHGWGTVLGGAVATVALGALVGLGVEALLRTAVQGSILAVGGAFTALLVTWLVPLQPAPFTVCLGALARDGRRWVRVVAGGGVGLSGAFVVGHPVVILTVGGSDPTPDQLGSALTLGLLVGLGVGVPVALVLAARLRPTTAILGTGRVAGHSRPASDGRPDPGS